MESFLAQATIYFAAAVIAVPVASRLGLGSVLGYLAAGILIGPLLGLVGSETEQLQHFAEFGVVMMLFLIGMELDPRALWAMRHKLVGLGGLQIGLTTALIMGGAVAFGVPWSVGLAIGLAFSLSSTAIVLQTLSEKGLMQSKGGRSVFSVLLTQDIAVIPMLALLPLLALPAVQDHYAEDAHGAEPAGHGGGDHGAGHGSELAAFHFFDSLPGWGLTLVILAALGGIVLAGIYLSRPVFSYIHNTRLREMYTALALLIVVGIASLMHMLNLSPALGAFLAGVVLANSEFRHEIESYIAPFKGLLLGLFFITVGAGIDFPTLFNQPIFLISATLAIMIAKGAVLYGLAVAFGLKRRHRWLFTLGLAQAGEFGFVLISFALQQNVIPSVYRGELFLIIALSMLLTPLFFLLYEEVAKRLDDVEEILEPDEVEAQGPVIIAGVGRFGQVINRMVMVNGYRATVLDNDLGVIQMMRKYGFKSFLGDPSRPELLQAAGLKDAKVLVVAMDDRVACERLVTYARKERPDLFIVARAHDVIQVYELYNAGADKIVREMFDSSLRAARYVLEELGLSEFEAAEAESKYYQHERHALRELVELWKPGVPVAENPEYMARSKELDTELETAMVSEIDEHEEAEIARQDAAKRAEA